MKNFHEIISNQFSVCALVAWWAGDVRVTVVLRAQSIPGRITTWRHFLPLGHSLGIAAVIAAMFLTLGFI